MLHGQPVEFYGAAVETRARSGFQPPSFEAEIDQAFAEAMNCEITGPSRRIVPIADVNQTF